MDANQGEVNISFGNGPDLLEYPRLAASRIAARYPISESCATVCLIDYHWDEEALSADIELSLEQILLRVRYMSEGKAIPKLSACVVCNCVSMGTDQGCGHTICSTCFQGYCRARVRGGDIKVLCTFPLCGKVYPPVAVNACLGEHLSFELETLTLRSFVASRRDSTWCPSRLCCCLITHQNWPQGQRVRCGYCGAQMLIQANGNAVGYDDSTFANKRGTKRTFVQMLD